MKFVECPHCEGSGKLPDNKWMGEFIRTRREKAKVSLRTMATKMGITPAYLSDLERNRRHWPATRVQQFTNIILGYEGDRWKQKSNSRVIREP